MGKVGNIYQWAILLRFLLTLADHFWYQQRLAASLSEPGPGTPSDLPRIDDLGEDAP
jgi:hypothetical protein